MQETGIIQSLKHAKVVYNGALCAFSTKNCIIFMVITYNITYLLTLSLLFYRFVIFSHF